MPEDWDKRFYHGRYNKYPFTEVVSFIMGTFRDAKDRKDIRVLDLGCGGAHHLMFLAQEGFDYYGVDGSHESVEIATGRLKEAGYDTSTIRQSTFEKLPYEDNFFDAVIDRGSITCNRKAEIPELVAEVKRVLKPGGYLFSTFLNMESSSKDTGDSLGEGDYINCGGRLTNAGVLHFTTSDEAHELFGALNVKRVERSIQTTDYSDSGDKRVVALNFITAQK